MLAVNVPTHAGDVYLPGLHPPATRATGAARASSAGARLGFRPATSNAFSMHLRGSTCRRSAPARSPARRCRSIPTFVAAELGFAATFENSIDAVGSRDHVAEALFALTMVAINLSRIGEEFVLWTTDEFGFATLDDGYATGSSMLPQKKNPDIAELARGKAGRAIGNLTGFLATMKGLPLSYNRDYQEDKEPLFDVVEQVTLALGAVGGMIATATWNTERMQAAADSEVNSATDLAEWLVQRGMPFRDAHALVGQLVRRHLAGEGTLRSLVAADPALGPDAAALVAPGVAVQRRTTAGGAGPGCRCRAADTVQEQGERAP